MFGRASLVIVLMALACLLATPLRVTAADRHSGYYYPDPGAAEVYVSRGKQLPGVNRTTRIGFVTGLTAQQSSQPYPALTAIFAKGSEAEKLIIVSLTDGRLNTIYRARAVLALMTAMARTTKIFQKYRVETVFTFLDLCKMLGFTQLTISDGIGFSHQFKIR
ncbi:MAG: molybdopterin-guanine dinucleotide biosynthesis protein A [Alphaproteobacteria bacterium]|jgi:hypothetical protein|nr:molybdopterin-guanine dinucleotide biosynthesis protein A [Alphaproteobacteria bacterium]